MITFSNWMGKARHSTSHLSHLLSLYHPRVLHINSASGSSAVLPDARTLIPGGPYWYISADALGGTIRVSANDGSTLIVDIPAGSHAIFFLLDNSTQVGDWRFMLRAGTASGITRVVQDGSVIGGFNNNIRNRHYEADTNVWSFKTIATTSRTDACAFKLKDAGFFVGCSVTPTTLVESWVDDAWTARTNFPDQVFESAACALKDSGLGYVISGQNQSGDIVSVHLYDHVTDSWIAKSSIPSARRKHTALGGKRQTLKIFSGNPETTPNYHYDAQDDAYRTIAFYAGASRENISGFGEDRTKFYIAGGHQPNTPAYFDLVEEYDEFTNSWTTKSPLPGETYEGAAWDMNGIGYYAGGRNNSDAAVNTFWNYESDTWKIDTPLVAAEGNILNHGFGTL